MKTTPASSRHLSAFALDVHHELEQTGLFSKIAVKKTGSPKCALLVVCSLKNASTSQNKVAETLERIWNEAPLHYGEGQDFYEIAKSAEKVEMRFSTMSESTRVTGRIEVIGFE